MKKMLLILIAVIGLNGMYLADNLAEGGYEFALSDLQLLAFAMDGESGGGKVCNGTTDCPSGKSADKNFWGNIVMCCANVDPNITGHYHN